MDKGSDLRDHVSVIKVVSFTLYTTERFEGGCGVRISRQLKKWAQAMDKYYQLVIKLYKRGP